MATVIERAPADIHANSGLYPFPISAFIMKPRPVNLFRSWITVTYGSDKPATSIFMVVTSYKAIIFIVTAVRMLQT